MSHEELPDWVTVWPEVSPNDPDQTFHDERNEGENIVIVECSDETVGCDVEEWYPNLEYGYYILDMEYREVVEFATDYNVARAFKIGYEKRRPETVPLLVPKHRPQLEIGQ